MHISILSDNRIRISISSIIVILSLLFAGFSDLFPWQRTHSTISSQQYSRVSTGVLFRISDTSRKYGSLLGVENNGLKSYAGTSINDPGYEMLVGVLSVFGVSIDDTLTLGMVNYYIVWLSIVFVALVILFLTKDVLMFSIVFLLQIIFFKYSYPYMYKELVDQHGLVYPVTAIGFGFFLVYFSKINNSNLFYAVVSSIILGMVIGLIALFRNSVGYSFLIGCIASLTIIIIESYKAKSKSTKYYILACMIMVVVGYKVSYIYTQKIFHQQTKIALGIEDELPQASYHTVWHSAFVGLGYYSNSWGIKWSDANGIYHANKYEPGTKYLSERYFVIMRKLYFQYLVEHPLEYVANHIKKVYSLFSYTLSSLKVPVLLLMFILVIKISRVDGIFKNTRIDYKYFIFPLIISSFVPILTHYRFSASFITILFYLIMVGVLFSVINAESYKVLKNKIFT